MRNSTNKNKRKIRSIKEIEYCTWTRKPSYCAIGRFFLDEFGAFWRRLGRSVWWQIYVYNSQKRMLWRQKYRNYPKHANKSNGIIIIKRRCEVILFLKKNWVYWWQVLVWKQIISSAVLYLLILLPYFLFFTDLILHVIFF